MYTSKINPGDTYDKLKKCITINILDFKCIPIKKLHTTYHITEDETKHKLTDMLEIHFLELLKLFDNEVPKNENDPIVQWMQFIHEKARMAYEAREAEIRDQLTRIKPATMKGRKEGRQEEKIEIAKNLLKEGLEISLVLKATGFSKSEVEKFKKRFH